MHKKVSRNTCCFHRIAVFANIIIYNDKALVLSLGSSVHHFEHVTNKVKMININN